MTKKKETLSKVLAIIGSILVWFPVLAPFATSAIVSSRSGMFRFDYLMPAELFPSAIAGGGLLLWAALRAHLHEKIIGWSLGSAAVLLVGGQAVAAATGLASGAIEPTGWEWAIVLASITFYALALAVMGIGGLMLIRDLFKHRTTRTNNS